MPLIPNVGRRKLSVMIFSIFVYASLIILGSTMVIPFMITVSGSTTNDFDYERFRPVPRYLWSQPDRFVRSLVYFFNNFRSFDSQMRCQIPDMPPTWTNWNDIGKDQDGIRGLSKRYLDVSPETLHYRQIMAADYVEFMENYPLSDTTVTVVIPQSVEFMQKHYIRQLHAKIPEAKNWSSRRQEKEALKLLSQNWKVPMDSFFNVNFSNELNAPLDFQGYFAEMNSPRYQDFLHLKDAYARHQFTPGVKGKWQKYLHELNLDVPAERLDDLASPELKQHWLKFKAIHAPASPCAPYALRASWYKFLCGDQAAQLLQLSSAQAFDINLYNQLAGSDYKKLERTPFPLPLNSPASLQKLWRYFVENHYPLRLIQIEVTPEVQKQFHAFLQREIKHLRIANELLGTNHTSWSQFELTAVPPSGVSQFDINYRDIWKNFIARIPQERRILNSSEISYQKFVMKKYGTLAAVNTAYNCNYRHLEEIFPPFAEAVATTVTANELAFVAYPIIENYLVVSKYLLFNANAVPVTIVLVGMTILCTLIVNPLAAYAMSRFNIRGKQLILLLMLATMAFPSMVSAIPAYLLMRDLNLLNTFFALVLPNAANGMAIFMLKGFFDSLPQELFEAASIDGASELQIFRIVAMPLVKPILVINCLSAFILSYNRWEWALIICQDQDMWTIAVWMYQASIWWNSMPWIVCAGFLIASIPTLVFFLACQKMILRGIVIPSMK